MLVGKREGLSYARWEPIGPESLSELSRSEASYVPVRGPNLMFSGPSDLGGEWGQELGKLSDRTMAIWAYCSAGSGADSWPFARYSSQPPSKSDIHSKPACSADNKDWVLDWLWSETHLHVQSAYGSFVHSHFHADWGPETRKMLRKLLSRAEDRDYRFEDLRRASACISPGPTG